MVIRMLGLTATAVAVVLTATSPAVARGGGGHDRGLIVAERYSTLNGGNPQIVAVRPGDGHVQVLTSGHRDVAADLSPDGRNIVFERCLHAVNCDQIGTINIWTMRADGSNQHPLTACDGSKCLGSFDPAFSPDGHHVAFAQDRLNAHGVNLNGIFIMRADGTRVRRITSNGADTLPSGNPHFSPDGRHLVFVREVPGGNQLMVVGADGTGVHPLLPGIDGSGPNWSPDGNQIAFTVARHTADATTIDIATVRPDGTHMRIITDQPVGVSAAFEPDFSPSGRRLVFSEPNPTGCHLVTMNDHGQNRRTLTTGAGCYFNPSWGPAASPPR